MVEAMPHHASDRLGAKAPAGEKTHLAQAFGGIGRRMTELALPDGAGTVELTGLQLAAQSRRRFGAVQAQFMLDAPVAEASDAGVDAADSMQQLAEVAASMPALFPVGRGRGRT